MRRNAYFNRSCEAKECIALIREPLDAAVELVKHQTIERNAS